MVRRRSPERAAGSKDEKAMVRERRYVCRLTPFDFTGALRDYQQLRLRCPPLSLQPSGCLNG